MSTREALLQQLLSEVRADQDAQQAFDEAAAERLGINLTDLRCLGILEQRGAVPATALAREAGLTTGSMTTLIDRLERAGYVRRSRDDRDRRRVYVELTERAQELIASLWGPLGREGAELVGEFSTAELEAIVRYLQQSRALLSRHTERIREMRVPG